MARHFIALLIFALIVAPVFGGAVLVQSFVQQNSYGDTEFGSVSNAGDLNGDGYDDIAVGASRYQDGSGRVTVYFGTASAGPELSLTLTGEETSSGFGHSVAAAGDINQDGYDDLIVGAFGYNDQRGRVYLFLGGAGMDAVADVVLTGTEAGGYFGYSVSGAGDLNGDGYDDFAVGAPACETSAGHIYAYFGGVSPDGVPDVIAKGEAVNMLFGQSVSGAGDANGDGYDDLIVGAQGYSANTGRAYLFRGGADMDAAADAVMTGEAIGDLFGAAVSGAGDLNGDGYDDAVVGAYRCLSSTGRVYVFFGGSSLDGIPDAVLTGDGEQRQFGFSLSGAGDLNNDGFDDLVIGADHLGPETDQATIYLGGLVLDNAVDLSIEAESAESGFGHFVSGAGDINGDGYDDFLVGAPGYYHQTGRAYIYSGGSALDGSPDWVMTGEKTVGHYFGSDVSAAGDINGDGYDDVIVGEGYYDFDRGRASVYFGGPSMDNTADLVMTGGAAGQYFGYRVCGTGDLNGDGFDDLAVSAPESGLGKVYLFWGGPALDDAPDQILNNPGSSIAGLSDMNGDGNRDLAVGAEGLARVYFGGPSMDNQPDLSFNGESEYDHFGFPVASAGDVNGDGTDDLAVAAYQYESDVGRVYVYFGGPDPDSVPDVIMTGETWDNQFGYALSGTGDMNGDGFDDLAVGAPRYGGYTGRTYVFFGGAEMDGAADVVLTGEAASAGLGSRLAAAGDMNGDGFQDLMVSENGYAQWTGRVHVCFGGSSMDAVPDISITGSGEGDSFGGALSFVGDADGDGIGDILIGAPGYQDNTGKVYLYSVYVLSQIKLFLEGPYQSSGEMAANPGLVPLTSPFHDARTVSSVPDGAVDWVETELRASESGPALCRRSFFLKSDGGIVEPDGITHELKMPGMTDRGYYLVLRHRNHLAAMSASSVLLDRFSVSPYDFSDAPGRYHGSGGSRELETGVWGMWAGDVNRDGQVTTMDYTSWYNSARLGESGYRDTDIDMDGFVTTSDYTMWYNNARLGAASQVP